MTVLFNTDINLSQDILDLINEKNIQLSLKIIDGRDEEEGFDLSMLDFEWEFVSF